jgi:hypothetical protein
MTSNGDDAPIVPPPLYLPPANLPPGADPVYLDPLVPQPSWVPYLDVPPPPPPEPAPPEPAPRRHRVRWIVLAAAALAVAGLIASAVVDNGHHGLGTSTTIVMPESFGAYQQLTGPSADRIRDELSSLLTTALNGSSVVSHLALATYTSDSGDVPTLVAVAGPRAGITDNPRPTDEQLTSELGSFVATLSEFPAGPAGGALQCGAVSVGAVDETVCAWADSITFGLAVAINSDQTTAQVAATTQTVQSLIEH